LPLEAAPGALALTGSTGPEKRLFSPEHVVNVAQEFSADRVGGDLTCWMSPDAPFISADRFLQAGEEFSSNRLGSKTETQNNTPDRYEKTFSEFRRLLIEAAVYRQRGRYDDAIGCYQKVIEQDPGRLESRAGRAAAYIETERYDLALDDLDVVIQLSPDPLEAYALRGLCRSVVAKFGDRAVLDSALADVGRATQKESLQPIVRLARGMVAVKRGNYDQAVADFSWVLECRPFDTLAYCYRGYALMANGEFDRAVADFHQVIQKWGDRLKPWVVFYRGECHAAMGNFDSAISDFNAAIKQYRDGSELYQHRARAYEAKGNFDLALADLDQVIRLRPDDPEPYVERSTLLIEMKQNDRAQKDANRIVELWPKDCAAYDFRALVACLTAQDWNRALSDVDCAIKLEPRYFLSYAFRAFLDVKAKKYDRALADLTTCAMTMNQCDFEFTWRINTYTSRFFIGVSWTLKDNPVQPKSRIVASEKERRLIEQGVERLLAAALRP